MKKNFVLFFLVVVLALAVGYLAIFRTLPTSTQVKEPEQKNFHFANFMQSEFYSGILKPDTVEATPQKVYGAIVSHHFYAERQIAGLFQALGAQDPKTIVVIGPNHFGAGTGRAQISGWSYKTPWGDLATDKELYEKLLATGLVKNEETTFEREHSISVLVGFIKHQFPEAKFLPIVIKRNYSLLEAQNLAEGLRRLLPEDSLVIASVDFSHHVTNQVAQSQDRKTLKMLENFDYAGISKLKPEAMDSPPSIIAFLKYLELKGAKKMEYTNTNQALLSGNLSNTDVTSYFFATFIR